MSEKTAVRTREKWVDGVKVIACILVVLGHFFQSMTKANILPENDLYEWFNTTIYYFHVPLFFICSGYLYQKYSKVNSVGSWYRNVAKKVLVLGVPSNQKQSCAYGRRHPLFHFCRQGLSMAGMQATAF